MPHPKISAYIGFAARARKLIIGVDGITRRQKRRDLIVYSADLGENSVKQLSDYAQKTNSPIIMLETGALESILKKEGCKAVAVIDAQLAQAIQNIYNA